MTRMGRRLIEDFLLPALNDGRYGDLLKWVDREKSYFSIRWSHKNAAKWSLSDTAVFQDWDRLKGHYHPEVKGYYMQAKQRFRAALYKLNSVVRLACEDKHVKKYQLVLDDARRRDYFLNGKHKLKIPKQEQRSIPTSVICKNTSYIDRRSMADRKPIFGTDIPPPPSSPPASPASSESSTENLAEMTKCMQEYQLAQKKQMLLTNTAKACRRIAVKTEVKPEMEEEPQHEVLRENPFAPRAPHVPTQPVPVYNKMMRQVVDCAAKRFESPHVLLVKTYNDEEENRNLMKEDEASEYVEEYIIADSQPDVVLNLSVKSDDSDALSR